MIKGFRVTALSELGKKELKNNMGSDRRTKIILESNNPLVVAYYFNYKGALKVLQKATVTLETVKLGVAKFMIGCSEGQDYLVEAIQDE